MNYLKANKDFYTIQLNTKAQYELWFENHNFKKGDTIYCDMCVFTKDHTYIKGEVIKAYKHKVIIKYNYVD